MPLRLSRGWRRVVDYSVKALIVGLLLWALYGELQGELSLEAFVSLMGSAWRGPNGYMLLLAIGLMPFNWGIEVQKWRVLLRPFWQIPTATAWKAVMAGVTLSLFTPNRIGEYGGRVLLVPAPRNWAAVIATAAGSMAQLIALLGGGLAGSYMYLDQRGVVPKEWTGMWWLVLCCTILLVLCFLYLPRLAVLLRFVPLSAKWQEKIGILREYKQKVLFYGLCWASFRYALYCVQFYLLLQYFGASLPLEAAFGGIATLFFIQLFLPLPPVAALLARGEAALLIWAAFSPDKLSVICATFALFIINLLPPALLGAVFIVKINVLKSLGYDKEAKRFDVGPDASPGIYHTRTEPMENNRDAR